MGSIVSFTKSVIAGKTDALLAITTNEAPPAITSTEQELAYQAAVTGLTLLLPSLTAIRFVDALELEVGSVYIALSHSLCRPHHQAKRISLGMSAMRRNNVLAGMGISPMQLDPHHIRSPVHVRTLVQAQTRNCHRCKRPADKPTYCYVRSTSSFTIGDHIL